MSARIFYPCHGEMTVCVWCVCVCVICMWGEATTTTANRYRLIRQLGISSVQLAITFDLNYLLYIRDILQRVCAEILRHCAGIQQWIRANL